MGEDRQEQSGSPQADIVSLIERSLVAVRRDQSRRHNHADHNHADHPHGDNGHGEAHGWGPRGPWGGYPGPFGDSARSGPGRRGRDGSLGRIARFRMLEALAAADAEGRQVSVSSLATAIGVDQPRASRLVQEGVERGLVRRVPDPSDARRALLQLTAAGRSQLGEVQNHRRSAVEAALAAFTPEEARTFAELFDRFVRAWPR